MNALVVADSWGLDWPGYAGIPAHLQQAVGGSSAKDWAADRNGMLRKARSTPAPSVIICLAGNDVMGSVLDWRRFVGAEAALDTVVRAMLGRRRYLVQYANPTGSWLMGKIVHQANVIIDRVARKHRCELIPTWQFLRHPEHFRRRDVHMNDAGARRMAAEVQRIVK